MTSTNQLSAGTELPQRWPKRAHLGRAFIAIALAALALGYALAIVLGYIAKEHRLDGISLAALVLTLVVISLVLSPTSLERLKLFELKGFKLELLERVKDQEDRLADITLVVPILFPLAERNHLLNLAEGRTARYKGGNSTRQELRRLRTIGLLQSRRDRPIGELKDGAEMDLSELVELTPLGRRWARRLRELESVDDIGRPPSD